MKSVEENPSVSNQTGGKLSRSQIVGLQISATSLGDIMARLAVWPLFDLPNKVNELAKQSIRLMDENARLRDSRTKLVAALKFVEWSSISKDGFPVCPSCLASRKTGHPEGCEIGDAIASADEETF